MVFSEIIKKLGLCTQDVSLACGDQYEISQVSLLEEDYREYDKQTLYFGYASQLDDQGPLPAQCVLADDGRKTKSALGGDVAFVEQSRLFSLFNKAMAIIKDLTDMEKFRQELIAGAVETKGFESFVNTAAARLGNSVILLDMGFQIIAHSTIYQINDEYWAKNVQQGYCSYDFVSAVMELDSIKNGPETHEAVEVTCFTSPYKKLSSRIYTRGVRMGTILMLEKDTPIGPEHMALMGVISRAAGEAVALVAPHHLSQANQYQRLLYDLLIGATEGDVHTRIASMGFPERMVILVIQPTRYLSKSHLQENVVKGLKELLPGTQTTHYLGRLVALVPAMAFGPAERLALEALCLSHYVAVGVSNEFENVLNAAKHYEQGSKALEASAKLRKDSPLCFYVDYLFHDLLDLVQDNMPPGRFCHPALSLLSRYDHEHKTALYQTLKVYLQCSGNQKETAAMLFIHRNSLAYRMAKIVELTGIDLLDSNVRFLLFMSYEIDRHIGRDF